MPLSARVTDEAADLDDAIEIARLLAQTLDMPQRPDAMTITDANGTTTLFRRPPRRCEQ